MNDPTQVFCTILVNGVSCPVTNMMDIDGDELGGSDTLDMVCCVVAQLPDGRWLSTVADYCDLIPLQ
jgi:hypothetical protein